MKSTSIEPSLFGSRVRRRLVTNLFWIWRKNYKHFYSISNYRYADDCFFNSYIEWGTGSHVLGRMTWARSLTSLKNHNTSAVQNARLPAWFVTSKIGTLCYSDYGALPNYIIFQSNRSWQFLTRPSENIFWYILSGVYRPWWPSLKQDKCQSEFPWILTEAKIEDILFPLMQLIFKNGDQSKVHKYLPPSGDFLATKRYR